MTDNRRSTFRCRNRDHRLRAVLRLDARDTEAELVDQSAGGFAVVADWLPGAVGQTALLRTVAGWSEVEIVRRHDASRVTLGLRRLADIPDPRALPAAPRAWLLWVAAALAALLLWL